MQLSNSYHYPAFAPQTFKQSLNDSSESVKWAKALGLNRVNPEMDGPIFGPNFRTLKTPSVSIAGLKTRFRIGIEFEGMVNNEIWAVFRDAMHELCVDEDGESMLQFGVDGSIKNIPEGYRAVEIRTETMKSRLGIVMFENMLSFLYIASQTNDFITNDTCGLHINISECDVFEAGQQVDFYCHILSHFEEHNLLEMFNRVNNKYCLALLDKDSNKDFASVKHQYNLLKRREKAARDRGDEKWKSNEGKYLAVSLRDSPVHDGYNGPPREAERIEFRCIGGKDYHLQFEELNEAVNHIIAVCRQSYRETHL